MSKARDLFVSLGVLLAGRGRAKLPERERIVPEKPPRPGWEATAVVLFGLAALSALAFPFLYAFGRHLSHETQWLGLSLGLAFVLAGAGLVVAGRQLIVTEEIEEDYPPEEHPEEQELLAQAIEETGDSLVSRRLFVLSLAGAVGAIGVAAVTPLVSLGPVFGISKFFSTPWRRGRRLVDESGRPWKASDIEEEDFYTAFPEGADEEELGSPVVLVRLPQSSFDLPPELAHYPANGIVAYSKICTHAGCAISLYRAPLFQPDEPKPALVCPCHYSTFNPADGGSVQFGPAGRKLPMLPLEIDRRGYLRAAGNFDEAVGPSWWGVRNRKPSPA
ncbi:MAG TPA: Rieske 2Fe-2S domain-containing protein [Gaiellaceae bacterium]|nr:Rieske 2Fe-2S domain-containing protein [Gaiellaceae bacterium]